MIPNILTVPQAAEEKGCSRQAVYMALRRGALTPVEMGTFKAVARDDKYRAYRPTRPGKRKNRKADQTGKGVRA